MGLGQTSSHPLPFLTSYVLALARDLHYWNNLQFPCLMNDWSSYNLFSVGFYRNQWFYDDAVAYDNTREISALSRCLLVKQWKVWTLVRRVVSWHVVKDRVWIKLFYPSPVLIKIVNERRVSHKSFQYVFLREHSV